MNDRRRWLYVMLVIGALYSAYTIVRDARLDRAAFARPRPSFKVTASNGDVLRVVRPDGVDHVWVELADVSPHFLRAIIAAEDARFYSHEGVDARALVRAVVTPILPGRRRSGASTIAQQVVKLTHPRTSRVRGKLVEIIRARTLIATRGRERVLEEYVNRLPFGNHIVGIERASQVYFGKPARSLTLDEAALLAGVPQAPSRTEPFRHAERARARRGYVLTRLAESGAYDAATLDAARVAPVQTVSNQRAYRAARFVDRVIEREHPDPYRALIATSLDLDLQSSGETLLHDAALAARPIGVTNASGIVLDVSSGEVLAYIGAALEGEAHEGGGIDLVRRRRHPGSTLKPFAYRAFFARGGSPASVLDDLPHDMTDASGRIYAAENFDGALRGRVTARSALSASLNLAALDVARRVGADVLANELRAFGFEAVVDANEHGGAVVLGGVSVTPFELARAYLALARNGDRIAPSFIPRGDATGTRVSDGTSTALVTDVLMDSDARTMGFGSDLRALAGDAPFALKTGTSPGFRDAWAAVYDAEHVVVVWFGDPRGRPTRGATGFSVAAPVAARWLAFARGRSGDAPPVRRVETTIGTLALCTRSGQLAGAHCPVRFERVGRDAPSVVCDGRHEDAQSVAQLRIVHPAADSTFLVANEQTTTLRVRIEGEGPFRIELDGRRISGALIPLRPGNHSLTVHDAHGHSKETHFAVTRARSASLIRVRARDFHGLDAEGQSQTIRRGRDIALRRRETDVEGARDLFERELLAVA